MINLNKLEINVLNDLIDNMDKILIEKHSKYQDTWKTCDVNLLYLKLHKATTQLFVPQTNERRIRELVHIENLTYFLYYRLKQNTSKTYTCYLCKPNLKFNTLKGFKTHNKWNHKHKLEMKKS